MRLDEELRRGFSREGWDLPGVNLDSTRLTGMGPEALSRGGRRVGGVAVASADLIDRAIEISRGIAEHDGLLATRSGSRRIFARSSTTVIVSAAAVHGNATTAGKQENARMDREADFDTGSVLMAWLRRNQIAAAGLD